MIIVLCDDSVWSRVLRILPDAVRCAVRAGIVLTVSGLALVSPPVAAGGAMDECNVAICWYPTLACSPSNVQAVCFVECQAAVAGACFPGACEGGGNKFVCWTEPE